MLLTPAIPRVGDILQFLTYGSNFSAYGYIYTIHAALRVYGVQGARPLQDALQKVAGAYTVERARVEAEHATAPEAAQSLFAKASGVIKKTADLCDNLSKVGKFGEQAWTLAGTVGPLVLPYIPKFGG